MLPSAQLGFSPEFVTMLDSSGAGEYVCELAYRRGGFVTFREIAEITDAPLQTVASRYRSALVRLKPFLAGQTT